MKNIILLTTIILSCSITQQKPSNVTIKNPNVIAESFCILLNDIIDTTLKFKKIRNKLPEKINDLILFNKNNCQFKRTINSNIFLKGVFREI